MLRDNSSRNAPLANLRTVKDFVAIGFRHRRVMLLSFLVVLLGGILGLMMIPSSYEGEMRILVDTSRVDPVLTSRPNVLQTAQKLSDDQLNTELGVLESQDLLQNAVESCDLYDPDPWTASPLAAVQAAQFAIMDRLGMTPDRDTRVYKATLKLAEKLDIQPMPDSHLIQVNYKSPFPDRSQCVLTTLAQGYLDKHFKLQPASRATDVFSRETEQYRTRMIDSEEKLADYEKSLGVVSADAQRASAVQKLDDLQATYVQTQASIAETEHRMADVRSQLNSVSGRIVTQVRTSDSELLIQNLKASLVSLEVQRIALLEKFSPTYRSVQEIDKQIAATREGIAEAEKASLNDKTTDVNPTAQWLDEELAKNQADLVGLNARANAERQAIQEYQAKTIQLDHAGWIQNDLMRTVKADEGNYLLYLGKQEEARSSAILDRARITNVALAEAPVVPLAPTGLPMPVKAALLLVVSGMMSVGLAIGAEYVDSTVRTPDELEAALDVPVFASIPANGKLSHGNGNGNGWHAEVRN